jgi:hypothetical protein
MSGRQAKAARVIPIASRRRIRQLIRETEAEIAADIAAQDAAALKRMRDGRVAWAVVGLALFAFALAALVFG